MGKIGYDNQKYIETQSAHIRERIGQFGGRAGPGRNFNPQIELSYRGST